MDGNNQQTNEQLKLQQGEQPLAGTGGKIQTGVGAAVGILGVLIQFGLVGASVSNPIFAGATILSALLPKFFHKKQPAVQAQGLLGFNPVPAPAGASHVATVGWFLLQLAAIITAVGAWLNALPGIDIVPEKYRVYLGLAAAIVAALAPPLQRIGDLLLNFKK